MKSRKLKVWGGGTDYKHEQVRAIVCARTKKDAIEFINKSPLRSISYTYFTNYWCETGNSLELQLCSEEGNIWYVLCKDQYCNDYIKIS